MAFGASGSVPLLRMAQKDTLSLSDPMFLASMALDTEAAEEHTACEDDTLHQRRLWSGQQQLERLRHEVSNDTIHAAVYFYVKR